MQGVAKHQTLKLVSLNMRPKKVLTLCIIHQHPKVLLGMKKRGFGQGKWNGFGGKIQPGEDIRRAAQRELEEEAGITPRALDAAGVVEFEFQGNSEILEVHIFKGNDFTGTVTETEEMRPQWFHVNEVPFHAMWPDDKYWFPLLLSSRKFRGRFLFDASNRILEHELFEVEDIV